MPTTFGFSAFLRLLLQNQKPQLSAIRKRLGSRGDAYDFHRSLRLLSKRFLVDEEPFATILTAADRITASSERKSALAALESLYEWRTHSFGKISFIEKVVYQSPKNLFGVSFASDFCIKIEGKTTAIHIWNTKGPDIQPDTVYSALSLFPTVFESAGLFIDDLALLSLRNRKLYRLSDVSDFSARGAAAVQYIESLFEQVRDEREAPSTRKDLPGRPRPAI